MKVLVNGVELELTKAQAAKLAPKVEPEPIVSAPVDKVAAAQATLRARGYAPKASSWSRVKCAFGACDREFDPNGTGPWFHSGCPVGTQFYGKLTVLKREGKTAEYETLLQDAKDLAASFAS